MKVKLSRFASRITRKNINMETTLPLTISAAEGLIEQTAFFNNVVASSDVSGYYLIRKGEFAYNKSSSAGFPFGAVKKLERYEKGVLSTLYIVFDVDHNISHDYLIYFFEKACAISGLILGVNPFNQPGVEEYKKNMFRLLGKEGY